jgi:DNA-directed RNA polymerase subunit RPC12/RpoP
MKTEPDNTEYKALKTYKCPDCGKIICKGIILNLAVACPHCNKFVRIKEKVQ